MRALNRCALAYGPLTALGSLGSDDVTSNQATGQRANQDQGEGTVRRDHEAKHDNQQHRRRPLDFADLLTSLPRELHCLALLSCLQSNCSKNRNLTQAEIASIFLGFLLAFRRLSW